MNMAASPSELDGHSHIALPRHYSARKSERECPAVDAMCKLAKMSIDPKFVELTASS